MKDLTNYGVTLTLLKQEHLEWLRELRNQDYIRETMIYREHITEEMQRDWFSKIDPNRNYYFVFSCDGEPAGLVDIKNINFETMTCEGGVFMDRKHFGTDLSLRAAFSMKDFAFYELGIKAYIIKTLVNNANIQIFTKFLGYEPLKTEGEILYKICTRESYEAKTSRMRNFLARA